MPHKICSVIYFEGSELDLGAPRVGFVQLCSDILEKNHRRDAETQRDTNAEWGGGQGPKSKVQRPKSG